MPHPLLGLKFPEESSDEEYDPTTENTKDTDVSSKVFAVITQSLFTLAIIITLLFYEL